MNKIEVVKYGSTLVTNKHGVDISRIEEHVSQVCNKNQLIVVTSGAVAAGRCIHYSLDGEDLSETLENQKYFAGLGCTAVFNAFEQAFRNERRKAASYPITHSQLGDEGFTGLLKLNASRGVVSIINEADALSDIELMKLETGGDNDGLASHVAQAVGAKSLTLFTEKGGIFDDQKRLVELINASNIEYIKNLAEQRKVGHNGRGGLVTKIEAARKAAEGGIAAAISDVEGKSITHFVVE